MSENNSTKFNRIFGWLVAVVIILTVIGGLMMVGSPMKARDLKLDAKRLNNMQSTARLISCYADNNLDGLPDALERAKASIGDGRFYDPKLRRCQNLKWKTDPLSDADFEYKRLGEKSFELCGVFERKQDSITTQNTAIYGSNNKVILDTTIPRAKAGRHCYTAKNWS